MLTMIDHSLTGYSRYDDAFPPVVRTSITTAKTAIGDSLAIIAHAPSATTSPASPRRVPQLPRPSHRS